MAQLSVLITHSERAIRFRNILLPVFAVLGISVLLRLCYAGYLYEDDGLWFTAAEEILRGKVLYREIYFDKPPAIALTYAALFKAFGAHLIVIRAFTILYSCLISIVLYQLGRRLYDQTVALLAAVAFAVFSTTYATGHMQSLNTDFLMALPYAAGAGLLIRSAISGQGRLALFGGALTGVAFQVNSKAALNLVFFGILLVITRSLILSRRLGLFAISVLGFAAGALPFFIYTAHGGALEQYWEYVWIWGSRYAAYHPWNYVVVNGLSQTLNYLILNNSLTIGLIVVVALIIRDRAQSPPNSSVGSLTSDRILLIWLLVSFLGAAAGGRFYAHYFFQILPGLCLIAARGLRTLKLLLDQSRRAIQVAVTTAVLSGFFFTMVRFHSRTVMLTGEWIMGTKAPVAADWYIDQRNAEERMAANVVRDLADGGEAIDRISAESPRAGGPRNRTPEGPGDYLFVWGYRPEIYYWSGLLPASGFLSTQPLTGVAADVHLINGEDHSLLDDNQTAAARARLVAELSQTRPKYIIDELGFFNSALGIEIFPELREITGQYKNLGATGRFFIYRRRDLAPKRLQSSSQ